ncbi:universal stress protein [uncultured Shimia sp.]|uniref:universal stress protein n=1 Tax=uncultured Shimia sp. TaxID=573152 RepID=UPI00260FEB24|nr:universal stress protein [uncultured Shimia sp.]
MFDSLLLAVDINDPQGALRSTQAAVAMATHQKAELHILNVVPDDGMAIVSSSLSADHNAEAVDQSRANLEAWAKEHIPQGITTKLHVARGTVYDQIIKKAGEYGVQGIVVGAHSPALKDYLLGSNAARVARHANQSVFVIR